MFVDILLPVAGDIVEIRWRSLVAIEYAEHIIVVIRVFGNAGVGVGVKCCCYYSYD